MSGNGQRKIFFILLCSVAVVVVLVYLVMVSSEIPRKTPFSSPFAHSEKIHQGNGTDIVSNFAPIIASNITYSTICHMSNQEITSIHPKNVLIFGGTGFLASKLGTGLHHKGHQVKMIKLTEVNTPLSLMASYRLEKLNKNKVEFVNLESDGISKTISRHSIDSIVFIPSLIFDGSSEPSAIIERKKAVQVLESFVRVLEAAVYSKHHIQILLVTLSKSFHLNSVQKSWLKTLEVSASSYQGLYGIQTKILRVDHVYGEWKGNDDGSEVLPKVDQSCIHIDEVLDAVGDALQAQQNCIDVDHSKCVIDEEKFAETESWAKQYTHSESSKKDVLFSTYFTSVRNPMYSYKIKPKSGFFMKQWFTSAHRLGLNLVILHDAFDKAFIDRVQSIHPNIEFVKTSNLRGRTTNDYRFYGFKKYLEDHPEVRRAVLTDMRDVKIFNDPFKPMEVIGDNIYIGIDVSFYTFSYDHSWLRGVLRNCHRSESNIDEVKLHPFLNAGVLGGSRHMLLTFLERLTQYFDKSPHHLNCNMGTMNLVGHKYFNDYSYSGYPIQSSFKLGMVGDIPQGQAIKHKDTDKYFF